MTQPCTPSARDQNRTEPPPTERYPLVVVEWEDASNVAEWTDIEEAQAFENIDFDFHCTNVGYLIRDDETCVIVAARADGGFKQVGLIERIPRGMVRNVRRVDSDDFATIKRRYDANKTKSDRWQRKLREWRCFWTRPFGHRWNDGGLTARCVASDKEWVGNL